MTKQETKYYIYAAFPEISHISLEDREYSQKEADEIISFLRELLEKRK